MKMVVVVQAGQAVEPAALVPLQALAPRGRVVLVGDPEQLPATVRSQAAQRAGLPLSLFERLQQVRFAHRDFVYASNMRSRCLLMRA